MGLPGREDTHEIVADLIGEAAFALAPRGTLTMIVGSAPGNPLLPYEVAALIEKMSSLQLRLHSLYIWDRNGTLARDIGDQTITHDVILHACRSEAVGIDPLSPQSIIKTTQHGFNYGWSVTTPPDLAAFLVAATSNAGDLIVDPLCGLGEIGVQALVQGRRFEGCDRRPECVAIANARLAEHLPLV